MQVSSSPVAIHILAVDRCNCPWMLLSLLRWGISHVILQRWVFSASATVSRPSRMATEGTLRQLLPCRCTSNKTRTCTKAMHACDKPGTSLQAVACVNSIIPNIQAQDLPDAHFTQPLHNGSSTSCRLMYCVLMESNSSITKGSTDRGGYLLNV